MDLEYSAEIDGTVWRGVAVVPKSYFPEGFDKWNAYAIHGTEDTERIYKALYPVPGTNPVTVKAARLILVVLATVKCVLESLT